MQQSSVAEGVESPQRKAVFKHDRAPESPHDMAPVTLSPATLKRQLAACFAVQVDPDCHGKAHRPCIVLLGVLRSRFGV